jgi:protease IV
MKNKGLGCLTLLLAVALLASLFLNFVGFASFLGIDGGAVSFPESKPHFSEVTEQKSGKETKDKIVRIDLEGVIGMESEAFGKDSMGVDSVKAALDQALSDDKVKAIVLRVNSPGGEVTASDTLYHAVKEAAKKKQVVVYMDSMAASGGYYLSCGASKIVANETTLTGSIGVIIQTLNYSQAFGKLGLETMTFVSGNFKDTLHGSRPMRDDEKAYVQGLVTQMYDKFLGIVSEARGMTKEELKNGIADGRVFTGAEAKKKKLVDELGYIEDAYALAKKLGGSPDAAVVRYQRHSSLTEIFGILGQTKAGQGKLNIDISDRLLPRLDAGHMYLLPSHMIP